jgi:hypothetical protein
VVLTNINEAIFQNSNLISNNVDGIYGLEAEQRGMVMKQQHNVIVISASPDGRLLS